MQAGAVSFGASSALSTGLGVVSAYLVYAVLANRSVPFIGSDRAAFFALVVLGMTMCAVGGIGKTAVPLGWAHPLTLFGIVMGVLALALAAAVLTGRTAFLAPLGAAVGLTAPVVSTEQLAIVALATIMAAKWLVGLPKFFVA
jgi:hypothetical protein